MIAAALFSGSASQAQCAPVTFFLPDGTFDPTTDTLTTATAGAHIFYTLHPNGTIQLPVHSGDSCSAPTVRIGSASGSVFVPSGNKRIDAVAYKAGLLDSSFTSNTYDANTG